ncbi:MAG TPA: helix-turn-helix domain-containing protein [Candidatus Limnocylindrales bacterium]|nr:helix-turn-helix domain-containing protein [Candidatus Limnocylindrales bacterium]
MDTPPGPATDPLHGSPTAQPDPPSAPPAPRSATRERILDVALDHFSRRGYAATSLREIAQELGITKAALYYHFQSKEDILLALHLRLHGLTAEIGPLIEALPEPGGWERLIEAMVGLAIRNRRLITLHLREQQALGLLNRTELSHRHPHEEPDVEVQFMTLLGDTSAPTEVRVRRLAALGAVFGGLLGAQALMDLPDEELERILRRIALEVLRPATA